MGRGPLSERSAAFFLRTYAGLAALSRCCPPLGGMFPRGPQPCATQRSKTAACDLHALGTPPAFVLSQDQTLHCLAFPIEIDRGHRTILLLFWYGAHARPR